MTRRSRRGARARAHTRLLARAVLRYVPGTRAFERRHLLAIARRSRARLRLFGYVETVDPGIKEDLRPTVRGYALRVVAASEWDQTFVRYLLLPCVAVLVVCAALFGAVDAPWLVLGMPRPANWPWDSIATVLTTWVALAVIVPFLPHHLRTAFRESRLSSVIFVALVTLGVAAVALIYAGMAVLGGLRFLFGALAPTQLPLYLWPGVAAALALLVSPSVVGDESLRQRFRQAWTGVVLLVYAIAVPEAVAAVRAGSEDPTAAATSLAGELGILVPAVVLVPTWTLTLLIARALDWRRILGQADAILVDGLMRLLLKLEVHPDRWTDLSFKREVSSDLEDLARCVEYGLRTQLRSGDTATDLWLSRTTGRIAAGIRAHKTWVLTPKPDTYAHLLTYLADTFVRAARGEWDSLEQRHPRRIPRSGRWRQQLAGAARTLVLAVAPLAALAVLQQSQWALKGDGATQAIAVALLWAAVSLVVSFDPLAGTKLSTIKDLGGFPFGGSRSESSRNNGGQSKKPFGG
jgi:hypothetical protein